MEVTQRKVLLNDAELRFRANELAGQLVRRMMRIPSAQPEQILTTDEYTDLIEHYRDGFPWAPGRYTGTLSVTVHELKDPPEQTFYFRLSDANVQHIRSNVQLMDNHTRALALAENPPPPKFSWFYPILDTEEEPD